MANEVSLTGIGVSPAFSISAEELFLHYYQTLSQIDFDMVKPPWLGENGGHSKAMDYVNEWFPWADEKLVEPKYDGVCKYLGMPSNQPTLCRDYHIIGLFRAVDKVLEVKYDAVIMASVDTVLPQPPPTP